MPKIIRGKDRESRIERLENAVEVQGQGKKEKLGLPPWAKKDRAEGKPDHAKRK